MSKVLSSLILSAAICLLAACTASNPVTVRTDYDHAAHFGAYHSYVIDSSEIGLKNPAYINALESTLEQDLAARGLHRAAGTKSDLYLVPIVFTREKLDQIPTGNYTLWPSGYGRYGFANSKINMNMQDVRYTEGSLVVDFVDRRTHKLVFRGFAQAVVSSSQERNMAAMKEAVSKIVAAYP